MSGNQMYPRQEVIGMHRRKLGVFCVVVVVRGYSITIVAIKD